MGSPLVAWQVVARDPDDAAAFLEGLFGWQVSADNRLGYREIATGSAVTGGIWQAPPEAIDLVQLYVGVDDVDAAVERAVSLGAVIVLPRQDLPDGDQMAIVRAPGGTTWGLVQRR